MKLFKANRLITIATLALGLTASHLSYSAAGLQTVTATTYSSYAKTKYPILFVHGMFGYNRLGTAEFGTDYWYQILPNLARNGATVFAAQISPLESTEVRGEQLLSQVEEVIAITGQPKVNLIGHSHGGPTSRYILGTRPDLLSSITSVAGANQGSPIFTAVQDSSTVAFVSDYLITPAINFAQQSNLPSDFKASAYSVSPEGASAFNQKFSTGLPTTACSDGASKANGVYMYSWIGSSITTNLLDPDTIFTSLGHVLFNGQKNDGIVSVCSSKFGKTIRDDYAHNHYDETNQVLGLRGLFSPDPVTLYRQHANRLKRQGL